MNAYIASCGEAFRRLFALGSLALPVLCIIVDVDVVVVVIVVVVVDADAGIAER